MLTRKSSLSIFFLSTLFRSTGVVDNIQLTSRYAHKGEDKKFSRGKRFKAQSHAHPILDIYTICVLRQLMSEITKLTHKQLSWSLKKFLIPPIRRKGRSNWIIFIRVCSFHALDAYLACADQLHILQEA